MSVEEMLWAGTGFVVFALLFSLLTRFGVIVTAIMLGLLLCLAVGIRYGRPARLLHHSQDASVDQPTPGGRLPSSKLVRAQERSRLAGQGYQSQAPSRSPRRNRKRNMGQTKDEHPSSSYEQPQALYPQDLP